MSQSSACKNDNDDIDAIDEALREIEGADGSKSDGLESKRGNTSDSSDMDSDSDSDSELGPLWDSNSDSDSAARPTPLAKAQSRAYIEDDDGSDDEIPHTANEILEENVVDFDPSMVIDEQTTIEKLGKLHSAGERACVVQTDLAGEYRILQEGALLCFGDRQPLGYLSEVFGRLQKPMLIVRFKTDELCERVKARIGEDIYYVVSSARFELIAQYRQKGSDASNNHDEEVGPNEIDFSDDEAEIAAKRKRKAKSTKKETNAPKMHKPEQSMLVFSQPNRNFPISTTNYPIIAQVTSKDQLLARLRAQIRAKKQETTSNEQEKTKCVPGEESKRQDME